MAPNLGPPKFKAFPCRNELRIRDWGPEEIAFDHDNGDVIMETHVATEVCRIVKDLGGELFCGEGSTTSHYGTKTFQTE